jgi:hypothetical protein
LWSGSRCRSWVQALVPQKKKKRKEKKIHPGKSLDKQVNTAIILGGGRSESRFVIIFIKDVQLLKIIVKHIKKQGTVVMPRRTQEEK